MDYFCDAWLLLTQAVWTQETVRLALSGPDGEYDPTELTTGSTGRRWTSHTSLTGATAIPLSKKDRGSLGRGAEGGEAERLRGPDLLLNSIYSRQKAGLGGPFRLPRSGFLCLFRYFKFRMVNTNAVSIPPQRPSAKRGALHSNL